MICSQGQCYSCYCCLNQGSKFLLYKLVKQIPKRITELGDCK